MTSKRWAMRGQPAADWLCVGPRGRGSQEDHLCISCPVSCDVMTQEVVQDDGLSKSSSDAESYTIVLSGVRLSTEICRTEADGGLSRLCPQTPVPNGAGWPLGTPITLFVQILKLWDKWGYTKSCGLSVFLFSFCLFFSAVYHCGSDVFTKTTQPFTCLFVFFSFSL